MSPSKDTELCPTRPYLLNFCCLPTPLQAGDQVSTKSGGILDPIYGMEDEKKKERHNLKTFREPRSEPHMELTGSKSEMLPKYLTVTHSICHDCIFVSYEKNKHRPERQN